MAWFGSDRALNGLTGFEYQERRYLRQIKELKQALQRSEQMFAHERNLAVGLQRELRDANVQIKERAGSSQGLRMAKTQNCQQPPAAIPDQFATPETRMPMEAAHFNAATLNRASALKSSDQSARISPYAPLPKATGKIYHASAAPEKEAPSSKIDLPVRLPASWRKKHARLRALTAAARHKPVKVRYPKIRTAANRKAVSRTKPTKRHRTARFNPRTRLGRVQQKRRTSKAYQRRRNRQKPRDVFNHLARKGVFGAGYFVE